MICLLALTMLFGQSDLPSYGKIDSIKNFRRVYISAADEESRGRIIKRLQKYDTLTVVDSPDEAQFFIEYGELNRESHADDDLISKERKVKSQMRAYTKAADGRKTIVWAETRERETEHFLGMKMLDTGRNEGELAGRFIKALKKARGEKK